MTEQDGFEDFGTVYAGEIDFPPLDGDVAVTTRAQRDQRQADLLGVLAQEFYGPVPAAPDTISVSRMPIAGEQAERLEIDLAVGKRRFSVDAALWLPPDTDGPAPLICGLDFIGPVGLVTSTDFPLDPKARVSSRPQFGARDFRMSETLRGVSAYRWPVRMLQGAGYAVLVSCYGSWVPDDRNEWKTHGVYPLLGCQDECPVGAISLWAWAIQRLMDAAGTCPEIDASQVAVAGHSRLGKAALWAAANDRRIGAAMANNSGCGGSAPAAHPVGETLEQMAERFPHWTIPPRDGGASKLSFDQHHLLSLIAPRTVFLAAANADIWADPIGSYCALREASEFWRFEHPEGFDWPLAEEIWRSCGRVQNGPLGYHLRPGGHDILPYDWRNFLDFLKSVPIARNGTQAA